MTKIFYGLPIWLVQTGPVNIEVVINVDDDSAVSVPSVAV